MTSPMRPFPRSQPHEQIPISKRAWLSLLLTQIVAIALLVLFGVFTLTVYVGYVIWGKAAGTAALVELAFMQVGCFMSLGLGLWSLHLRLKGKFKAGSIIITGAIGLGLSLGGILLFVGFLYLVTTTW